MMLADLPEIFPTPEIAGCKSWMLGALPTSACGWNSFPNRRSSSKCYDELPPLPRRNASCSAMHRRRSQGSPQNVTPVRRAGTPSARSRPSSASCHENASVPARSGIRSGLPSMGLLQGSAAKLECRAPCKMQQLREELAERRADDVAAKAQRAREHKEKLDGIKYAIVNDVTALGESAKFGNEVASLVEKRGSLLKVWDENQSVNGVLLQAFSQEVKCTLYEQKLKMVMPSWNLTDLQKREVVLQLVQNLSISELSNITMRLAAGSGKTWHDALVSAMESSQHFICPICMDPMVEISKSGNPSSSNMWFAPLRKNEHWSSQPCGHACCRSCMKMWAETAINDQKVNIRCPAPACSYSLFDHDVQALVSPMAFERLQEHRNADYLKHLKSALKEDVRLNKWLKSHCRPCPDCHVIVSRSEGCDAMQCVCGTKFCYACGFKSCKCNGQRNKRQDIWRPKVAKNPEASPGA